MSALTLPRRIRRRPEPASPVAADVPVAPVSTATWIFVCVAALAVVGLVMVLSSSSVTALRGNRSAFSIVGKHGASAVVGALAMYVGYRIDHRTWQRLALPLFAGTTVLLVLVLVPGIGRSTAGARRWIGSGELSIQPAELAKLSVAFVVADILTRRARWLADWRSGLRPAVVVTGVTVALVMLEPDMGTSSCILLVLFGAAFAAAVPLRHLAALWGGTLVVGALAAWHEPYRRRRVLSYQNPFEQISGDGYQVAQGLIGLGQGGPTGLGLGQGRAKWGFLPNAHTDFIFAVIGEEAGLVGTVLVLGLFLVLAGLGLRTALRAPDRFGTLLAAGLTTWLVGQAILNVATVIGLMPVTGVPLPFVSFGGTALVVSFLAAGILASIARAGEQR